MSTCVQIAAAFRIGLAPGRLHAHPDWLRMDALAADALSAGRSLLVIGAPGTGKSLFLQDLEARMRASAWSVRLRRHGAAPGSLDAREVMLIDEADALTDHELRACLLRGDPVVLAGLPGLAERVTALGVATPATVRLGPLPLAALTALLGDRLRRAGLAPSLLDRACVSALHRQSGGVPRVALLLAGAAQFSAAARGARRCTAADVDEAAAMRAAIGAEPVEPAAAPAAARPRSRRHVTALAACVLAFGAGAGARMAWRDALPSAVASGPACAAASSACTDAAAPLLNPAGR